MRPALALIHGLNDVETTLQGSALKAISGALIKEWAAFVLKEVKARQALEGQLLQPHSEFGQIKMWLVSQLDVLRKEAKEGATEVVKEFNLRQLEMADNMSFQVRMLVSVLWRGFCCRLCKVFFFCFCFCC